MWEINQEERPVLAVFNAYDPEGIDLYAHATGYMCCLNDIEQELRTDYKYKELPEEVYKYVEKFKEFLVDVKIKYHLPD